MKADFSTSGILKGIFLHEYNGQMWFVQTLILFCLLAPIIYYLIKSKIVGAICIVTSMILFYFNIRLPNTIFGSGDAGIYYLVGAYIGNHYFDIFSKKADKSIVKQLGTFLLFAISTVTIMIWKIKDVSFIHRISPIFITLMALSFWRLFDLFSCKKAMAFERESFLIYALHMSVGLVCSRLIYAILPKITFFAPITYILSIVMSTVFICTFGILLGKHCPKIKSFLTGGR